MKGYPVVAAEAVPGRIFDVGCWVSLGGQGDGIYHLMDAVIDGKPTLVGGHRGDYRLLNLLTGEVLFDFTGVDFYQPPAATYGAESPAGYTADQLYRFIDPITTPQMGLGSYDAQCKWFDPVDKVFKYYYGGYIKVFPSGVTVPTTTNDQTYKHSFVLETVDHKTWRVILNTRNDYAYVGAGNNSTAKWVGEVSGIFGAPGCLYISLGDGHKHLGVYRYFGGGTPICNGGTNQATELAAALLTGTANDSVGGMVMFDDAIFCKLLGSTALRQINHKTSAAPNLIVGAGIPVRGSAAGTYTPNTTNRGNIGSFGRLQVIGCEGGLIIGDCYAGLTSGVFVPLFPSTNQSATIFRAAGWRSPLLPLCGGLIFAVNTSFDSNGDAAPSYLCFLAPGGVIHVLAVGGFFHQMRQFNDRLYYSVSPLYDNGTTSYYRNQTAMIDSIPIERIGRAAPPVISESFVNTSYTSATYAGAFFAAYPTAGYSRGEAIFNSDTGGNLTFCRISAEKSNGGQTAGRFDYPVVAVVANTPLAIDMATYLKGGDVVGVKFSVSASISGRITIQP